MTSPPCTFNEPMLFYRHLHLLVCALESGERYLPSVLISAVSRDLLLFVFVGIRI